MSHKTLRAFALAAALPLASTAFAAGELATAIGALSDRKLGAPCVTVHEGKLAHADFDVALGDGVACPVLAGATKLGWFFSGTASFRYVSRDRIEHPVVRSNAKTEGRVSLQDVEGGFVAVTGSARTVFFAVSSGELPNLEGGPA